MQELKNEHEIVRQSKDVVLEKIQSERVLTNQEVYNFYAKLKQDKLQIEQQLLHAQQTIEKLHKSLETVDEALVKWRVVGIEAEKSLSTPVDVEKLIKNKKEAEAAQKTKGGE